MKTCLLCGTQSPDDAATCPADGEASWSTPSPADAPEDSPEAAPEPVVEEPVVEEPAPSEPSPADAPAKPKARKR